MNIKNAILALFCVVVVGWSCWSVFPIVKSIAQGFSYADTLEGISYEEFVNRFGNEEFDPQGASNIFYSVSAGRDSYTICQVFDLSSSDYLNLRNRYVETMKVDETDLLNDVRQFYSAEERNEVYGNDSHSSRLKWWKPPSRKEEGVERTTIVLKNKIEYWLYDNETSKLWIHVRN